ncbi:MAG TPA: SRPBCC domain-containing protein [Rhizomicrobium sp.]|jgi:uncharacterized protein YndB with AHSA1/START domain
MKSVVLAFLLAAVPATAMAADTAAGPVKDHSFTDADGHRVLRETIVVKASLDSVWKAYTTDAGFMRWAAPVAHITPGNNGMMESALEDGGKIGDPGNVLNRIDVYLPDSLIVFHNEHVPAGGPMDPATFASLRSMLAFEPAGDGFTRVTQTVIGFGESAKYDDLYRHLRDGNAAYLAAMAKSVPPEKTAQQ